jgi:phage terminase large subunit-like protein
MRIMTTNGRLVLTETPLLGVSDLMLQYMPELNPDPEIVKPKAAWETDDNG